MSDSNTTGRHTPEARRSRPRRPPVSHIDNPSSRDAVCELLGVTPRTVQRRIHAGDIVREEGAGRPWYTLRDTKRIRSYLSRQGWSLHESGAIVELGDATAQTSGDDSSHHPRWKVEHEALSSRVDELASAVDALRDGASQGDTYDDAGDTARESDADERRAFEGGDTLTGWRAVCVALLMRLKALLDSIIRSVRGEG